MPWWDLGPFVADEELADGDSVVVNTGLEEAPRYRGSTPDAVGDLQRWVADGWRVVVVTEGPGLARRVAEVLADESVAARLDADLTDLSDGVVHLTTGTRRQRVPRSGKQVRAHHRDRPHGHTRVRAARPRTCARCPRGGATRSTRSSSSPATSSSTSSTASASSSRWCSAPSAARRASTSSSSTPPASAANRATGCSCRPTSSTRSPATSVARCRRSTRWAAATGPRPRARARKYVKQIAAELIQLYSARMATAGPRLRAGHPVAARARGRLLLRRDARPAAARSTRSRPTWSAPCPMDRLICGDVGYGKTEIAVRAAFKAIQDGKQVAVLVPTTLLVQQHLQTFTERYQQFPVTVACAVAVPERQGGARDHRRARRRQRRPRHRHAPAARRHDPATRTSAWSSSTRSSASGSSTRSSSRPCAPPSTCSPCRPRRSRARSRWP